MTAITKRVDCFLVGAQKCGTTSLAAQLGAHPAMCLCSSKEPHFFSRDHGTGRQEYHALFSPENEEQLLFEASTSYSFFPEYVGVPELIKEYSERAKIIYVVRNPVARIESHYAHRVLNGRVKRQIDEEVWADPAYINRSRYAMQINPYIELFGRRNVHIMVFEEYVRDNRRVMSELAVFLGIAGDRFNQSAEPHRNASSERLKRTPVLKNFARLTGLPGPIGRFARHLAYRRLKTKPRVRSDTRSRLQGVLAMDMRLLEEEHGVDLSAWRSDDEPRWWSATDLSRYTHDQSTDPRSRDRG